ncbi:hypothetical protein DFQ27_007505 [Actinomortierella ambigua]|uniref:Exoribonuclease phosphorolytic domain-containing protein n=1 Tax=Actinomortierella ambigua TaxID=1343610 RepID=A0A9P6PVB6_9FUNG|nr:hypothetical protein DFQ27_007505 [Actinomortierella ambigua]
MDRKRVAGPENAVAPLVEYPKDQLRWAPQQEHRHSSKRQPEDIRPIYLKTGLINQANGSAYIELERTKIACGVYGPRQKKASQLSSFSGKGTLNCEFKFATFSCQKRRHHIRDAQERELSQVLSQALAPAVRLELFPKSVVDVYVTVLENDGLAACLAAAITCASVALAHAGIEMLDLVAACSGSYMTVPRNALGQPQTDATTTAAGASRDEIWMDADLEEEKHEDGSIVLAYMPSLNQVTHVLQNGRAEGAVISQSVESCIEACNKIYAVMQHSLLESITNGKTQ